jgi:hypothetical protein
VLRELDLEVVDPSPEPPVRRRFTFAPKNDCLVTARPRVTHAPAPESKPAAHV